MSILAAPRKKQRIGVDPQNKKWKNDTDKFGHKLMEKMGWSEGKGLGAKEQGVADPIKLKANYDSRGLGCETKYDETWIAHHDDFAELLAKLNANKKSVADDSAAKDRHKSDNDDNCEAASATSDQSLEHKSKKSKARIHYQKFTRGKDLARYSSQDKSSVLGEKSHKRKAADQLPSTSSFSETDKGEKGESQVNTTTSSLSVSEYFAMKMKKLKKSTPADAPPVED